MELVDLAPVLRGEGGTPSSGFRVFDETLASGGRVKAIVVPGMGAASRAQVDELTEMAKRFGARGLVHLALALPTASTARPSSSSARSGPGRWPGGRCRRG